MVCILAPRGGTGSNLRGLTSTPRPGGLAWRQSPRPDPRPYCAAGEEQAGLRSLVLGGFPSAPSGAWEHGMRARRGSHGPDGSFWPEIGGDVCFRRDFRQFWASLASPGAISTNPESFGQTRQVCRDVDQFQKVSADSGSMSADARAHFPKTRFALPGTTGVWTRPQICLGAAPWRESAPPAP